LMITYERLDAIVTTPGHSSGVLYKGSAAMDTHCGTTEHPEIAMCCLLAECKAGAAVRFNQ